MVSLIIIKLSFKANEKKCHIDTLVEYNNYG